VIEEQKDERRRYERYAVRCDCWIEGGDASIFGATADLGLGGVFLRTAVPLDCGQQVDVALSPPGQSSRVLARGIVTRSVRPTRGRRHGVGVEFLDVIDGRDLLSRMLGRRSV